MNRLRFIVCSLFMSIACLCMAQTQKTVKVMYFFGKQRCVTCCTIEKLAEETVNKYFAEEVAAGKVSFAKVDMTTKEGEKIADKYEVAWSSLFVDEVKGKKVKHHNMTEFAFANAKNRPEEFKKGLVSKIKSLLEE